MKKDSAEVIVEHWGSIENFDLFIRKVKEDKSAVAKLAIKEFGSVEKYTEAMRYNLEHFSEIMEQQMTDDAKALKQQYDHLYIRLTEDITRDVTSNKVQQIVREIDCLMHKQTSADTASHSYWKAIINYYSSDYEKAITDTRYGAGASAYIVKAFQYYADKGYGKAK